MKGIKKYLAAVCVIALSGVLLAGCSGQGSSSAASASASSASASASASASSAASQASTADLIKEIEAIPGLEDAKSVTIDMQGNISMDMSAIAAAVAESGSAASASASAASAAASEAAVMDVPFSTLIKADNTQADPKLYMKIEAMTMPFELYINGNNAVMVIEGQAFSGTLDDLKAAGMGDYSSMESAIAASGASSFDAYKNAIDSITKESKNGQTVYTIVLDDSKLMDASTMSTLQSLGISGDASKITITYTVGADGKLVGSTMEMGGNGFAMTTDMKVSDYDTTVVPDAPAATQSFSDLATILNTGAEAGQAA